MTMDPQIVNNLIMGGAAWGLAILAALWLSLILWTYRDIRSRGRSPLMHILAVIVVVLLFLPGIVIYLILRPPHTLDEEYQHTLEEEALLQTIEDQPVCPGCGRHIRESWMVCPSCYTKLKKPCQQCQQLMELSWNLCPYCGTPAPGVRKREKPVDDVSLLKTVGEEASMEAQKPVDDQFTNFIHVVEKRE